jgi:hypothetical protein
MDFNIVKPKFFFSAKPACSLRFPIAATQEKLRLSYSIENEFQMSEKLYLKKLIKIGQRYSGIDRGPAGPQKQGSGKQFWWYPRYAKTTSKGRTKSTKKQGPTGPSAITNYSLLITNYLFINHLNWLTHYLY